MKKLLPILCLLAFVGCSDVYDDSEIKGKYDDLQEEVDNLREDVDEIKALLEALDKNLFVESVEETADGYIITLSDNSTIYIKHGKDGAQGPQGESGKDGDSFFQSVTQDEQFVYFTLADGTIITLPKGAALDITFEESDLVVMSPSSTREIGYTVTSATDKVTVEVTSSADIKAKVVADDATGKTGKIVITTGEAIDEYSKVIVFVANGEKVTMKSISFEQAGLEVSNDATLYAPAEGGNVTLSFLSNVECEVVIPEEAQAWISLAPTTRAMTERNIALQLTANEGYYRSSTVTVQSTDGKLAVAYTIEQEGVLFEEIDPTQIPDNEIWYTSTDGQLIPLRSYSWSDDLAPTYGSNIVSHEYRKGKGVITFDGAVTAIKDRSLFSQSPQLKSVFLPNTVEIIGHAAFGGCTNLITITLPSNLKVMGYNVFFRTSLTSIILPDGLTTIGDSAFAHTKIKEINIPQSVESITYVFKNNQIEKFSGKFASEDGLCVLENCWCGASFQAFANGSDVTEYSIPEGVNIIENYAFGYNKSLRKLTIPSSVSTIGSSAFLYSSIEYFDGVYASSDHKCLIQNGCIIAFAGKGLNEYTTPQEAISTGWNAFSFQEDLLKLTLSDNITECGYYSFIDSDNLQEIVLSARLNKIYEHPWGYIGGGNFCKSLKRVYLRAPIPPKMIFVNDCVGVTFPTDFTVFVPEESYDLYMISPDWSAYRNHFKPYDYGDLSEFYPDYYFSTDYSQDGVVTTLQTATVGEGIDIVLMGDAYSDRQIADGTYEADINALYNNLFTEEPYKSHKEYFNVYSVNVVSATEGYEYGNTALDTYFGDGTTVGGTDSAVFNYAQKAISAERMDEAMIVVAMNSDAYAGTCWMYYPEDESDCGSGTSISYFPRGGDAETFAALLHHEANGHGFAKLADEYAYEEYGAIPDASIADIQSQQASWGWWKNVDFTNDTSAVRWAHFLADERYANEGLGAFEGGLTYWSGVWRPTENSIMRYNTGGFNAPSREAIYYRIHKLAYGAEWEYDYEEFVEWDARNRTTTTASAPSKVARIPMKQMQHTAPPVVVKKSWREAATN